MNCKLLDNFYQHVPETYVVKLGVRSTSGGWQKLEHKKKIK